MPVNPYDGNWAAWLGGENAEHAYIGQRVYIPRHRPVLSFFHWIASEEDLCGKDIMLLLVNANRARRMDLCQATNTYGWRRHDVDLSAYNEQFVMLHFRIMTDNHLYSNILIDNVFFSERGLGVLEEPAAAGSVELAGEQGWRRRP